MPMKEIKDLKKWADTLCSQGRRFSIVDVSTLPTLMYRFNAIPVQISRCLVDMDETILKFIWKDKGRE